MQRALWLWQGKQDTMPLLLSVLIVDLCSKISSRKILFLFDFQYLSNRLSRIWHLFKRQRVRLLALLYKDSSSSVLIISHHLAIQPIWNGLELNSHSKYLRPNYNQIAAHCHSLVPVISIRMSINIHCRHWYQRKV